MSTTTYKEYLEIGRAEGLSGEKLIDFASTMDARVREERTAERLAKKEEQDRLQRDKDREANLELEKLKLEKEASVREGDNTNTNAQQRSTGEKYKPKLPYLTPTECLFTYILRFEDTMRSAHIPEDQWTSRLRDLLTGQVLRTFQDISTEDKQSFNIVKDRLLASQNLNAEGYRKRFNTAVPPLSTSFGDYVNSLKSLLSRWLTLSNTTSFQGLCDLVIKNKILQSCNTQLCSFLIERDPPTVEEIIRLGDNFTAAHPGLQIQKETSFPTFHSNTALPANTATQQNTYTLSRGRNWNRNPAVARTASDNRNPRGQTTWGKAPFQVKPPTGCIYCGNWRHTSQNCNQRYNKRDDDDGNGNRDRVVRSNQGCFLCNGPHMKRVCPRLTQHKANSCTTVTQNTNKMEVLVKPQIIYPSTSSIPEPLDIQLHRGFVNNKLVTLMFDTGANVFGVHRDLVPSTAYTGRYVKCRTFSGNLEFFPLARLFLRTPYFCGWAECCVLRNPAAQLIVGQMTKVTPRSTEEIQEWYREVGILNAGAVTTRAAQRQYERRLQQEPPVPTPQVTTGSQPQHIHPVTQTELNLIDNQEDSNMNFQGVLQDSEQQDTNLQNSIINGAEETTRPKSFAQEQQEDSTLKSSFNRADKGDLKTAKN